MPDVMVTCPLCGGMKTSKNLARHRNQCDGILRETPEQRFWSKVDKSGACWLWTGALDADGYGRWDVAYKHWRAHRYAWVLEHGEVTPGLVLDHICRVRACVNPAHLREVTDGENVRAGIGPTAINARKTRCIRNHEFDGAGKNGNRTCSRCHEIKRQERRARAAVKQEGAETDV